MNLKFNRVTASNFNSFEKFTFNIKPGRHIILGEDVLTGSSNGSGKSSLMEALVWCIYKKSLRGNDPSTNGRGNCVVTVDLDIDGKPHRIERGHKVNGSNYVKLYCDEEDISARVSQEVDAQIEKLIGIPYELFISTCVVLQGLPISFTQFTPAMRKSIFESILGFSIWDNYKKRVDQRLKIVNSTIDEYETELLHLNNSLTDTNARIETISNSNDAREKDIKSEIDSVRLDIQGLNWDLDGIKKQIDELCLSVDVKTPDALKTELRKLHQKKSVLESEIYNLNEIINSGVCPTCEEPYKKERLEDTNKKIDDKRVEVLSVDELLVNYEDASKKVNNVQNSQISAMQRVKLKKIEFSKLTNELASLKQTDDSKQLKITLNSLVKQIDNVEKNMQTSNVEKERLDYVSSLLLPSSKFRTHVLEDYMNIVTRTIEAISPSIFPNVKIVLKVNKLSTGIDIEISRNDKFIEYRQLSGGEKRRLDVIIILSIQKFLLEASGTTTNLLVFDEIMDGLDMNGIEGVLYALESVFVSSTAMYVISHQNNLKAMFDSTVQVTKIGGVSTLHG